MRSKKGLSRIEVMGFRSLKKIDLSLGRVTVLIGPNGSGKSNLLALLRMVAWMRTQSLCRFVGEAGGASALLHYGPRTTSEIELRLELENEKGANAYRVRLGYASGDALVFLDESVDYRPADATEFKPYALGAGHSESSIENEAEKPAAHTARVVRGWLSRMNFFHFHDTSIESRVRQSSKQADDRFLRSDGSNLATYLRCLATSKAPEDMAAWKRIGMLVRQIAPHVKALQPELVDSDHPDQSAVRLFWTDERDYRFDVHDFSDGTLRAIALITALAQPTSRLPLFMSIDEPELGLHPAAISLLVGLIRSVQAHCQVLLATQSPALLDHFSVDEVVVAEREEGATSLRRLDAEALKAWLEDYKLSDLYDKNVLGGRP